MRRKYIIGLVIVTVLTITGIVVLSNTVFKNNITQAQFTGSDVRMTVAKPKSVTSINKEFFFPIRNDKSVEVGKIQYILESAELRDEIIVKGQKATTTKGRTFLIINIKIKNELNKRLQINSRDYIRLSVGENNTEWLAGDVHSDPVEVQAISTKFTRVGFPINDTDRNLKLQIGEINGAKEIIDINFAN